MTEQEKKAAEAEALRQEMASTPEGRAARRQEQVVPGSFWDRLQSAGTAGYSALNSALFGLPEVALKASKSPAYAELKALRDYYRPAATLGDIGGMLVPTGGALAGAIGKGAKALGALGRAGTIGGRLAAPASKAAGALYRVGQGLDTAGDIIRTGKGVSGIGGAAARGALTAAEQSIPRMLGGTQTAEEGAGGMLAGAGLGAAGGLLAKGIKRIPETAVQARKWANKTILKNTDITSRVLRNQEKYMSGSPEKYMEELASLAESKQLHREPQLDAMVAEVKDTWRRMGDAYNKAGSKVNRDLIKSTPEVVEVLNRTPGASSVIDDLAAKVDKTSNFYEKRKFLSEILYDQNQSPEQKKIAKALIDQIESEAEHLTGLDIGEAKQAWKMMKPFEMADLRDEINVATGGIKGGSPTAFNIGLAGLTGAGAAATQVKGVVDDPTDPNAWAKLALYAGGGSLMGGVNKQMGLALARAVRGMTAPEIQALAQKVAQGKGPEIVKKLMGKVEKPSIFLSKLAGAGGEGPAQQEEAAPEADAAAQGEAAIAGTQVEAVQEEKKAEYGPEYIDKLNSKMVEYWAANFAGQMEYTDYAAQVAELTNGFDPKKTASFFYRDKKDRSKFLRDLEITQSLKGQDFSETIKGGRGILAGGIEDIFTGATAERKAAKMDLVDSIARLMAPAEGGLASKEERAAIEADIKAIAALKLTPEQKQRRLFDKLEQKYGLDYTALKEMGLA